MMHITILSLISLLGLLGFLIASYIHEKKQTKKKLVCPMRSNCETVIHSDYSKIARIPVEILGMMYYAFIATIYSIVFICNLWSDTVGVILLVISIVSVLFSLYLLSIQAFVIKQWCTWCIGSVCISVGIFVLSYIHILVF